MKTIVGALVLGWLAAKHGAVADGGDEVELPHVSASKT